MLAGLSENSHHEQVFFKRNEVAAAAFVEQGGNKVGRSPTVAVVRGQSVSLGSLSRVGMSVTLRPLYVYLQIVLQMHAVSTGALFFLP